MNRIDRLTAMLVHLQTKKVVTAEEMASRFEISLRTVYRDVKALMEAGVPIGSEAGKGYFIVDGYHLPPVMFTQDEASAMILANKLVDKMGDKSIRTAFTSAMLKIRAVLNEAGKDHVESLENHMEVFLRSRYEHHQRTDFPDHFLTTIQRALVHKDVLRIEYSNSEEQLTTRDVEPIGIFYYSLNWHLIAWCRLRKGYRDFRVNRIRKLAPTGETCEGSNHISLKEYFENIYQDNPNLKKVVVLFDKDQIRGKPIYGCTSQTDLGTQLRVEFMVENFFYLSSWLLTFGSGATVVEPPELKQELEQLVEELYQHYVGQAVTAHH
ncbi:MAG: YafY family protein [Cyclobacteriaceae bacterium]